MFLFRLYNILEYNKIIIIILLTIIIYIINKESIILYINLINIIIIVINNDIISIFLSIEIISMCIYLYIFKYNKQIEVEYIIYYYIINSISSLIILYGLYNYISKGIYDITLIDTNIYILIGLIIKLGIYPFHIWIIRVYTNLTKNYLIYGIIIPKLSYLIILNKLLILNKLYIYIISILSILYVCIIAIGYGNNNIKYIIIYSSIMNIGQIILLQSTEYYYIAIYIYILNTLGFIYTRSFVYALALIGIPPLNGFIIKLLVLINYVSISYYITIIILVSIPILYLLYIPIYKGIDLRNDINKYKYHMLINILSSILLYTYCIYIKYYISIY